MTEFKQGDKIQLKQKPTPQKVIGGTGRTGIVPVSLDGQTKFLKYNMLFKVSSYTSEPIASLDSDPLPLIQRDFVNRNERINRLFELVESADES